MARRPYVFHWGRCPKGTVVTALHLRNLDQYSSELVNGEDGGEWAPESPLVLGSSVTPAVELDTGSTLTGDIRTVSGNSRGDDIDTPGLILQGGAYPTFATSRSRSIVVPFTAFSEVITTWEVNSYLTPCLGTHLVDQATLGAKTVGAYSWEEPTVLILPLPIRASHRGATISSVDFRYVITGQRTALPDSAPKFRVVRYSTSATLAMHDNSGGYDADGFLPDPAATAADYWNNGQTKTLTYTPNQYNTNLGPQAYAYALEIATEYNASSRSEVGNVYLSATVHLASIASMKPE